MNVLAEAQKKLLEGNLNEEEYKVWLDYHYKNCERKDLAGYSSHILYIGKKR